MWTKFIQHGPTTIVIDCNGLSVLIFEEKWPNYGSGPKIRTKKWLVLGASTFQLMRAGFLCPKCDNFACLHIRQGQNELYPKRWFFFFFAKIGTFCKSICRNISQRCSTIFVRRKDNTNYLLNQTWSKCYHSRNKHKLRKVS